MTTSDIQSILQGPEPDPKALYANFKPVRYRYVMAYLHDELDPVTQKLHKAGEVMYILPMQNVNYGVGIYVGTDMSGDVQLPEFYLDQMPHPPFNAYERVLHPDQGGIPLGSMFECGNRAIYVMRNEKVVWGGILWTRSYSSGTPVLRISAISFDAYVYYRLLRRSIIFKTAINVYTIWYAVLKAALTDFTWADTNDGFVESVAAEAQSVTRNRAGKVTSIVYRAWTGLIGSYANYPLSEYVHYWPYNNPKIELPPKNLKLYTANGKSEVKATKEWRGYNMDMIGQQLQEWADTYTFLSPTTAHPFDYRVVCWYDNAQQIFRQRYVFGEMLYQSGKGPDTDEPTPNGISSPFLGTNTQAMAKSEDNTLVFEFPGHITDWSLSETMEGCATRVVATDQGEAATKHAAYIADKEVLDVPNNATTGQLRGSQGWLLYDVVSSYEITTNIKTTLEDRATKLLKLLKVPSAQQLNDLDRPDKKSQRGSLRSTTFTVTVRGDPTMPLPEFTVGDWAAFAIDDPFYGGKMYLVRRIIGYTVTVASEQESDYSHEQIELELTDDTQIRLEE